MRLFCDLDFFYWIFIYLIFFFREKIGIISFMKYLLFYDSITVEASTFKEICPIWSVNITLQSPCVNCIWLSKISFTDSINSPYDAVSLRIVNIPSEKRLIDDTSDRLALVRNTNKYGYWKKRSQFEILVKKTTDSSLSIPSCAYSCPFNCSNRKK